MPSRFDRFLSGGSGGEGMRALQSLIADAKRAVKGTPGAEVLKQSTGRAPNALKSADFVTDSKGNTLDAR